MHAFPSLKRAFGGLAVFVGLLISAAPAANAQEKVRPEVGKPLQQAQDMLKSKRYKEALAKLHELDGVSGKTPNESFQIEWTRANAALGAGDSDTAAKAFEAVINSGKAPANAQLSIIDTLVKLYANNKDYASALKWGNRYYKEGGTNPQIRTQMIQAHFQSGDFANAAKESLADVTADEKAGRTPSEEKLQLLANSYLRQKNNAGYSATIEKMLNYYPKKSLWANVISGVQRKPGFSDRLALDVYRLQLATGNLSSTNDFMEMAQLALQGGFAAEGKKIIDDGYANGSFGKGAEAERHKRLKDLAEKRLADAKKLTAGQEETEANAAKDGNALVTLGEKLAANGQAEKGIALMEAGIKKGGLRRPEDAKLHLGLAYIQAGHKPKGVQTLKTVQGNDGVADLARLWVIFTQQKGA
jgi:outer membrane protein assembly factor BamD (BamD/ComL family)